MTFVQKIDLRRVTNQPWTLVATAYNYELERQDFLSSIHGLLEEIMTRKKKVVENMRSKDLVIPDHDEFKMIRNSMFEVGGFIAGKWYTSWKHPV